MVIDFAVGETPVRFERNLMSGRATATTPGGLLQLQDPLDPFTHFSLKLEKAWKFNVAGANVMITMKRALLFGALRPMLFRVFVNDELIKEQVGT